jgi:hypothetical protein
MDETIRISTIDKKLWHSILQGFESDQIEQVLEVMGADGIILGTICQVEDGRCYINGEPDIDYLSLQAAAAALMKYRGAKPN